MVPQTLRGGTVTLSSATEKKKVNLGKIPQNSSTMEIRRIAALNLLLEKDVDKLISTINQSTEVKFVSPKKKVTKLILQKKALDKNIEDITEEKGDKRVFLTPIQRNTPTLEDVFQIKLLSLSAFAKPASTNPGPDFPILEKPQLEKPVLPKESVNLKQKAEPLKGSPIRKTAKSNSKRQETDLQMAEILNMLYTLLATVEK